MIVADVIAGFFLPGLFGWFFLFFVLISESLLLSKYLTKTWLSKNVFVSVIVANLITTVIGYFLLDVEKNGGHLLNWIPVYYYHGNVRIGPTSSLFLLSFMMSAIIEGLVNWVMLKKHFAPKKVLSGTFLANLFTYIAGAVIMLAYHFNHH